MLHPQRCALNRERKDAERAHAHHNFTVTCARRNNYVTCAIISILAHATQFNPLSQHLSIFVRFVSAVTLTCGILAAVRRFSVG